MEILLTNLDETIFEEELERVIVDNTIVVVRKLFANCLKI